jgi:hypothetical protein
MPDQKRDSKTPSFPQSVAQETELKNPETPTSLAEKDRTGIKDILTAEPDEHGIIFDDAEVIEERRTQILIDYIERYGGIRAFTAKLMESAHEDFDIEWLREMEEGWQKSMEAVGRTIKDDRRKSEGHQAIQNSALTVRNRDASLNIGRRIKPGIFLLGRVLWTAGGVERIINRILREIREMQVNHQETFSKHPKLERETLRQLAEILERLIHNLDGALKISGLREISPLDFKDEADIVSTALESEPPEGMDHVIKNSERPPALMQNTIERYETDRARFLNRHINANALLAGMTIGTTRDDFKEQIGILERVERFLLELEEKILGLVHEEDADPEEAGAAIHNLFKTEEARVQKGRFLTVFYETERDLKELAVVLKPIKERMRNLLRGRIRELLQEQYDRLPQDSSLRKVIRNASKLLSESIEDDQEVKRFVDSKGDKEV